MLTEIFQPDERVTRFLTGLAPAGEERLRWSVFVYPLSLGAEGYLYHNLTKQCFRAEEALCAAAREGRDPTDRPEERRKLAACGFLVPEGRDETALYEGVQRLLRARYAHTRLRSYTILTTTACNARCFYCSQESAGTVSMSEETVERAIDFIRRTCDPGRRIRLLWFGGEPLMAPRVIDRVSAALEEAGIDFEAEMISNGILIDEQILAKMTGPWRISRIQISLDGAKEDYERRKAYRRSWPSAYRQILEVLRRLSETKIRVALRCNVDGDNLEGLHSMVDDLAAAIADKRRVCPYFTVLYAQRDSEEHAALFARCLEAKRYAHEKGFPYIPQAPLHRARKTICQAEEPYGSVVIAPDGRLYNCDMFPEEMENGDVVRGLVRRDRLQRYLMPEPVAERCRDCLFLPSCTSFSRCPVKIRQCREVRQLELRADLEMEILRLERQRGGEPEETAEIGAC